ncbi:unnamed protein product [Effrenium voratum]|nr:unnamed protein product [Effrenium voratum]
MSMSFGKLDKIGKEASQSMAALFRFVPFFLPEFLGRISYGLKPRLLFLDLDTVVLGDLRALVEMDLRGHAMAAARSCRSEMRELLDFGMLQPFGAAGLIQEKDCPVSRAVLVIDPVKWQARNISGKVFDWLDLYKEQPLHEELWTKSLTVSLLMLAVNEDFVELRGPWTCNDLGEEDLTPSETKELLAEGFAHQVDVFSAHKA